MINGTTPLHPICQRVGHRSDRTVHRGPRVPQLRCAICGELYGEDDPPPALVLAPVAVGPDGPGVYQSLPGLTTAERIQRIRTLTDELAELLPSGEYAFRVSR